VASSSFFGGGRPRGSGCLVGRTLISSGIGFGWLARFGFGSLFEDSRRGGVGGISSGRDFFLSLTGPGRSLLSVVFAVEDEELDARDSRTAGRPCGFPAPSC
jgi:hypothetical protein